MYQGQFFANWSRLASENVNKLIILQKNVKLEWTKQCCFLNSSVCVQYMLHFILTKKYLFLKVFVRILRQRFNFFLPKSSCTPTLPKTKTNRTMNFVREVQSVSYLQKNNQNCTFPLNSSSRHVNINYSEETVWMMQELLIHFISPHAYALLCLSLIIWLLLLPLVLCSEITVLMAPVTLFCSAAFFLYMITKLRAPNTPFLFSTNPMCLSFTLTEIAPLFWGLLLLPCLIICTSDSVFLCKWMSKVYLFMAKGKSGKEACACAQFYHNWDV